MQNIHYTDGANTRGPSEFWADIEPWRGVHPSDGWGYFQDFLDLPATSSNNVVLEEADNNATFSQVTGEECGVLRLTLATDDNEEGSVQWGSTNTAAPLVIDKGYGRMWFEARIRVSSVTSGLVSWVLGLAEEGFAASNCLPDTDALPTTDGTGIVGKDFVGFGVWYDDGDSVDAFYHTAGSASVIHKAEITTVAADTWIKLGIYFDGLEQVFFYVNGQRYDTAVLESATGFPDGEELSPVFAHKQRTTTGYTADIDWWAFAQESIVGKNS